MKSFILFFIGTVVLIAGIALVLLWWPQVVVVFKGAIGIFLALVGLVILALVKG